MLLTNKKQYSKYSLIDTNKEYTLFILNGWRNIKIAYIDEKQLITTLKQILEENNDLENLNKLKEAKPEYFKLDRIISKIKSIIK